MKGALLFELWTHHPYRPTRDLDLEGQGDNSITRIRQVFAEIISRPVGDDGLIFDPKSLRVARIREEQEYEGLRINFIARLERAKIHMQVDVGFGLSSIGMSLLRFQIFEFLQTDLPDTHTKKSGRTLT